MLPRFLPALFAAATLGGCAGSGGPYAFEPHPADVTTAPPGIDARPVRTLVSIIGVHRPEDGPGHDGPALAVRVRVENTSAYPVAFDPSSLVLHSGRLVRFPDPVVEPAGTVDLAPGDSAVVNACFPFPGEGATASTDLSGLNLRWTLAIDGQAVISSASFLRRSPDWYDDPTHRVGVGYHRYP